MHYKIFVTLKKYSFLNNIDVDKLSGFLFRKLKSVRELFVPQIRESLKMIHFYLLLNHLEPKKNPYDSCNNGFECPVALDCFENTCVYANIN